jgi:hypothetical protein
MKSGTDLVLVRNYLREERYEAAECLGGMNPPSGVAKHTQIAWLGAVKRLLFHIVKGVI